MSANNPGLPSSVIPSNDYILHPEYSIPGGDFYILARNTLFRVLSFFLARDSSFWRDKIEELFSSNGAPGSSESRPFYLNEDADEVAQFLSIPYTRRFNIYDQTPDEWGAIFRLADRWDAPGLCDLAISKIHSTPMDMAEKLRVFLKYNVPREVYFPLMEVLVSHDELPDDLVSIYVGGTNTDEVDNIPEGAEVPQVPSPSLEESNVFPIPPVSAEFTVSEGSPNPTPISQIENNPPAPVSSVPHIPITYAEGEEVVVEQLPGSKPGEKEEIAGLSDQWVIVRGNQNDDHSLSHPSMRRPLMLHDFIIPYCLFVSILSAFLA